jgi:hypothetical protein
LATFQLIKIKIEIKNQQTFKQKCLGLFQHPFYSFRIFTLFFKCNFVTLGNFKLLFQEQKRFSCFLRSQNEAQMRQQTLRQLLLGLV